MQHALERIGRFTLHIFEEVGVVSVLFGQTLKQLPRIQRKLTIRQMAHLGVDSLPIVSLTLLFAGMVMTLQIVDILMRYGAQSTLGGIMSVAMGRELGPILTGVVVAGRVGAAMTAELGTMKVTEQICRLCYYGPAADFLRLPYRYGWRLCRGYLQRRVNSFYVYAFHRVFYGSERCPFRPYQGYGIRRYYFSCGLL